MPLKFQIATALGESRSTSSLCEEKRVGWGGLQKYVTLERLWRLREAMKHHFEVTPMLE